mgnify:CR=1 FL=1
MNFERKNKKVKIFQKPLDRLLRKWVICHGLLRASERDFSENRAKGKGETNRGMEPLVNSMIGTSIEG